MYLCYCHYPELFFADEIVEGAQGHNQLVLGEFHLRTVIEHDRNTLVLECSTMPDANNYSVYSKMEHYTSVAVGSVFKFGIAYHAHAKP